MLSLGISRNGCYIRNAQEKMPKGPREGVKEINSGEFERQV
jgi:hypothetical protein